MCGRRAGRLLRAAVGFALLPPTEPELRVLHEWLDCWRGVGDAVTEMNRRGCWLPPLERGRRHVAPDVLVVVRAAMNFSSVITSSGAAPA